MEKQRNLILAIALSFLLLIGWDYAMQYFYPQPEEALVEEVADTPASRAAEATQHSRTGGLVDPALQAQEEIDVGNTHTQEETQGVWAEEGKTRDVWYGRGVR